MNQKIINQKLFSTISNRLGLTQVPRAASVGGGSINDSFRLCFDQRQFFCKINSASKFPQLFEKEKKGLQLLGEKKIIRVPEVLDCFEIDQQQVLVLEWIAPGERTENFWKEFGRQLSLLHQIQGKEFGLDEDNYMGSVVQRNSRSDDWVSFFIHQRLQPMVERCCEKNLLPGKERSQFEHLYTGLENFFERAQAPMLLHGDLWSGNFICDKDSMPVLIDPAVYYGHPAVDLGMTTLFGGFHQKFYEAYEQHATFPHHHKDQWLVCNLYPLLIHLLLFGQSYLSEIQGILRKFV
ncbi:MAG: fructosamine kinase family protein [Flavisolibacter sp.]